MNKFRTIIVVVVMVWVLCLVVFLVWGVKDPHRWRSINYNEYDEEWNIGGQPSDGEPKTERERILKEYNERESQFLNPQFEDYYSNEDIP